MKFILFAGSLFLCYLTANCQELPKILPPSPLAAAFARYGEIPVDYSTGVPDIQVPLYTIKCGSLELPINISYHGSGIKVQDIASPVGLGWVLNAGGVISRTILGRDDDVNIVSGIPFRTVAQIGLARTQATTDGLKMDWESQLNDLANDMFDLQSDRYTYNFNNHAGVFRKNFINNQFVQIPYSPIKITKVLTGGSYFEVADENGIKYEFKAREDEIMSGSTSWWVTKMTSANNEDVIEFIYKAGEQLATKNYTETFEFGGKAWWETIYVPEGGGYAQKYESADYQYNKLRFISYSTTKLIDKIICRNVTVKFNYLSDRIDPAQTRIESVDILQNETNAIIKRIMFVQSYFGNSMNNNLRLRLDSVSVKGKDLTTDGEKYSFSYNTEVVLPNYYLFNPNNLDEIFHEDYWGYYNGYDNVSQIPTEFAVQEVYYNNNTASIPSGNRNVNNNFIQACMLKGITYPTGGRTEFEFESNEGFIYDYSTSNHQGAGLRIKSIKNYDSPNHLIVKKSYEYLSSSSLSVTKNMFKYIKPCSYTLYDYPIPDKGPAPFAVVDFDHDYFVSHSLFPIQGGSGSAVYYAEVTEKQENGSLENGFTKYEYGGDYYGDSYPLLPLNTPQPRLCAAYHFDHGINKPLLSAKTEYKKNGAEYQIVKRQVNTYTKYRSNEFNTGIKVDRNRYYMYTLNGGRPFEISLNDYIANEFVFTDTKGYEEVKLLTQTSIYQDGVYTNVNYVYDNLDHLQPTSENVLTSTGAVLKTEYKYPSDFSAQVPYDAMISKNMLSPVIEKLRYKNNNLLEGTKTNYDYWNNGWGINNSTSIIVPHTVEVKKLTGNYETRLRYNTYSNKGNVVSVLKEYDRPTSYLWNNDQTAPVAEVVNANSNEIFFESFEDKLGWNGTVEVPQAVDAYDNTRSHTGKIAGRIDNFTATERVAHYEKVLNISLSALKKFRYSGWVYSNGPSADICLFMKRANEAGYYSYVDYVTTSETNKWVFLEKEFDVPADVTSLGIRIDNNGGSGSVWFDDIRLHPSAAQMTTYTYDPLIGTTSQTDANNRSAYYEYDDLNRLKLVRDQDKNILKRVCYNYTGQPEACKVYYNLPREQIFISNNCPAGKIGVPYTYTVAGNLYAALSQIAADNLANADIIANGQNAANLHGTCIEGVQLESWATGNIQYENISGSPLAEPCIVMLMDPAAFLVSNNLSLIASATYVVEYWIKWDGLEFFAIDASSPTLQLLSDDIIDTHGAWSKHRARITNISGNIGLGFWTGGDYLQGLKLYRE
jgi:hypothetical protein